MAYCNREKKIHTGEIKPAENRVYLKPGQACVTTSPTLITTVLGSCISAILYHRKTRAAAICHAVQPHCKLNLKCAYPDQCYEKYKYVSCVIPTMVDVLALVGIRPSELELKLFGGAAVLWRNGSISKFKPVGQMNVEAALETIAAKNLKLKFADVGGSSGKKILFDTNTGEVLLKRLSENSKKQY